MKTKLALLSMIVLAACRQQPVQTGNASTNDIATPANVDAAANDVPANVGNSSDGVTSAARVPDRTVLEEPKGPIDPKSTEAAGQVVQRYGALVEQGRFAEAASAWRDKSSAVTFAKDLQARGLKHLEIGDLSDPEGAAGSIYVTMPVIFYQDSRRSPATITLRRVNDVDGSTEAQRRWHIERIEWGKS